jgi:hypothetical protein
MSRTLWLTSELTDSAALDAAALDPAAEEAADDGEDPKSTSCIVSFLAWADTELNGLDAEVGS